MKKVLSFVLVLAMILGSVSLAFAVEFSDTKDTDYDEAATVLTDLEIISGYADGTFKPGNSITRAEFAAMMIRGLGFKVAGTSAVTAFSDVDPSYWASTYIKYASELGIIYGYGDGTFRPKNNITNDEAIAMLVRALGYKAQYLTGSFPTSHINVALGLGILDGIPTGSAQATRGDVAQLVFNALGQRVVNYDANGNLVYGNSMLQRHGAHMANGGDPFVVLGTEASKINLAQYVGAYVEAYANASNQIIGVSKVYSEFITGKITDAQSNASTAAPATLTFAGINDGKVGDYKVNGTVVNVQIGWDTSVTPAVAILAPFEYFVNGQRQTAPTGSANDVFNDLTYTFAVEIDGNYVTNVYSASLWNPQQNAWIDADALEAIKEDLQLLNEDFATDSKDEIDLNSFGLFGVDKLEDIKKENVVAVYTTGNAVGTGTIARVEVGTQTVSGTVSRVNSALKTITIGGTAYKVSDLSNQDVMTTGVATDDVVAGDKGTFYLDYQGRLYHFEKEDTTHLYGVVLDQSAGASGLNGATAKVQLFTEEGKKVVYVVSDSLVNYPAAGGAGTWKTAIAANDVIDFTLNSSGQINKITPVFTYNTTTPAVAANTPITKSGTIVVAAATATTPAVSEVISNNTVLFAYDGTNYSLVSRADVIGKNVNDYQSNLGATAGVAKVAVIRGVAGTDKVFYAFQKWDYVDNANYNYEVFFVGDDGKEVSFFTNTEVAATATVPAKASDGTGVWTVAPQLYELSINSSNGIDNADNTKVASDPFALSGTNTTCKKQGDVYVLTDGTSTMNLASDVTVFVHNGTNWTVKTVAALRGLNSTDYTAVDAFDLTTGGDAVYDVIFVQ